MLVTAAAPTPPRSAIKPWEELSADEKKKYRNDEVSYVMQESLEHCKGCATADELDRCMTEQREAYFGESMYRHARTIMEPPARVNTAVMTGLSSLARVAHPVGGVLGIATGIPLAFVGIMEGIEGVKNADRKLTLDAGFNVAIGAALTASAFTGGALLLAAPALVGLRELVLRR